MATTIQSTSLDPVQIKQKLKTYFQQQAEFADYDFEGSGLSNLLDVLAYNTHFNGLTANFALNEAFLTTAQLRSSVVAHAESLGYTPRSTQAAVAFLNLSIVNTNSGRSPTVTLPAYTKFTGSLDGQAYSFITLEPYIANDNGTGTYTFVTDTGSANIPVYEGSLTTKTFLVGETEELQIYVIPDPKVDTSSIVVRVFNNPSSSNFSVYTSLSNAVRVDSSSTYYDLRESPNGFFELHFSDGITTGLAPVAGNKIVVNYLRTNGAVANKTRSFTSTSAVSMDSSSFTLNVATAAVASGGAEKESIESIRSNAPIAYAAQARLVTALDYRGQILARYGSVDDCSAWGGQDNVPRDFGKVFLSLNFAEGTTDSVKQLVQSSIVNDLTSQLAIMSIDTEFVDPIEVFISCQVEFNYNPDLSGTPVNIAETQIYSAIQQYFANNLQQFGKIFRRSNLVSTIDNVSPAILNSKMDVKLERRFTPSITRPSSYEIQFPVALQTPTGAGHVIRSSNTFIYNGRTCRLVNQLFPHSTKMQVIRADGTVEVDNVGEYRPSTGVVSLVNFAPTSITGGTTLGLSAIPANQSTVKPLRNFILRLDTNNTSITGTIDYDDIRVTL